MAFLGQNGAGKSSLLRIVAGLEENFSGQVTLDKKRISSLSSLEKARSIAWLSSESYQTFSYSALDVVLMGRYPWSLGEYKETDYIKAEEALASLGLFQKKQQSVLDLSSGERKLVNLARVLVGEQKVIILDEPEAHLDLKNSTKFFKLLKEKTIKEKKIVLMASHHVELSRRYCSNFICLKSGQVLGRLMESSQNSHLLLSETFELSPFEFPSSFIK